MSCLTIRPSTKRGITHGRGAVRKYSSSGLLFRGKAAKIPPAQLSDPAITIAVPINSVNSADIALVLLVICLPIKLVLRVRGVAQIFPTVIQAVAVFVVDLALRPFACHPQPRQTAGEVVPAAEPNDQAAVFRVFFVDCLDTPDPWSSIFAGFGPLEVSRGRIVM